MTFSNVLTGFVTGFPVMVVVGPIALLLIEAGLERGLRGAYPAALGATAADATFATAAALAGVAVVDVLEPLRDWLSRGAVAVLVVLGLRLAFGALRQLRGLAPPVDVASAVTQRSAGAVAAPAAPAPSPLAVAGGFFGLTALNPLTIAVFTAIVLGGSAGLGTPGWVLGMAVASLSVNLGFVVVGHGLGTVLEADAVARVRLGAAVLVLATALHLALTA